MKNNTKLYYKLIELADNLYEKGFYRESKELTNKIFNYKKAEENLYNVINDNILEYAHPDGSVEIEKAKEDFGKVHTLQDTQEKIIYILKKEPTGKFSSLKINAADENIYNETNIIQLLNFINKQVNPQLDHSTQQFNTDEKRVYDIAFYIADEVVDLQSGSPPPTVLIKTLNDIVNPYIKENYNKQLLFEIVNAALINAVKENILMNLDTYGYPMYYVSLDSVAYKLKNDKKIITQIVRKEDTTLTNQQLLRPVINELKNILKPLLTTYNTIVAVNTDQKVYTSKISQVIQPYVNVSKTLHLLVTKNTDIESALRDIYDSFFENFSGKITFINVNDQLANFKVLITKFVENPQNNVIVNYLKTKLQEAVTYGKNTLINESKNNSLVLPKGANMNIEQILKQTEIALNLAKQSQFIAKNKITTKQQAEDFVRNLMPQTIKVLFLDNIDKVVDDIYYYEKKAINIPYVITHILSRYVKLGYNPDDVLRLMTSYISTEFKKHVTKDNDLDIGPLLASFISGDGADYIYLNRDKIGTLEGSIREYHIIAEEKLSPVLDEIYKIYRTYGPIDPMLDDKFKQEIKKIHTMLDLFRQTMPEQEKISNLLKYINKQYSSDLFNGRNFTRPEELQNAFNVIGNTYNSSLQNLKRKLQNKQTSTTTLQKTQNISDNKVKVAQTQEYDFFGVPKTPSQPTTTTSTDSINQKEQQIALKQEPSKNVNTTAYKNPDVSTMQGNLRKLYQALDKSNLKISPQQITLISITESGTFGGKFDGVWGPNTKRSLQAAEQVRQQHFSKQTQPLKIYPSYNQSQEAKYNNDILEKMLQILNKSTGGDNVLDEISAGPFSGTIEDGDLLVGPQHIYPFRNFYEAIIRNNIMLQVFSDNQEEVVDYNEWKKLLQAFITRANNKEGKNKVLYLRLLYKTLNELEKTASRYKYTAANITQSKLQKIATIFEKHSQTVKDPWKKPTQMETEIITPWDTKPKETTQTSKELFIPLSQFTTAPKVTSYSPSSSVTSLSTEDIKLIVKYLNDLAKQQPSVGVPLNKEIINLYNNKDSNKLYNLLLQVKQQMGSSQEGYGAVLGEFSGDTFGRYKAELPFDTNINLGRSYWYAIAPELYKYLEPKAFNIRVLYSPGGFDVIMKSPKLLNAKDIVSPEFAQQAITKAIKLNNINMRNVRFNNRTRSYEIITQNNTTPGNAPTYVNVLTLPAVDNEYRKIVQLAIPFVAKIKALNALKSAIREVAAEWSAIVPSQISDRLGWKLSREEQRWMDVIDGALQDVTAAYNSLVG